jgi:hypothetical protein
MPEPLCPYCEYRQSECVCAAAPPTPAEPPAEPLGSSGYLMTGLATPPPGPGQDREARLEAALRALIIDANRLCDRNLGGTYEADCRGSIRLARAALEKP